jgi:hypothetical protein
MNSLSPFEQFLANLPQSPLENELTVSNFPKNQTIIEFTKIKRLRKHWKIDSATGEGKFFY